MFSYSHVIHKLNTPTAKHFLHEWMSYKTESVMSVRSPTADIDSPCPGTMEDSEKNNGKAGNCTGGTGNSEVVSSVCVTETPNFDPNNMV